MHRRAFVSCLSLLAVGSVLGPATTAFAEDWKAGDRVHALWKGQWWSATVLETKPGMAKLKWDDGDEDEWMETGKMRAAWKAGDTVEVLWKGDWYKANVLEVKKGKYKIHYVDYGSDDDEWVATQRTRPKG